MCKCNYSDKETCYCTKQLDVYFALSDIMIAANDVLILEKIADHVIIMLLI